MSQNAVVRARVNEEIKEQAAAVLSDMGLTVSDLLRITLTKVAHEKALPFPLNPNAETVKAMRELDSEKGTRYASPEAMFKELGI